MLVDMKDQQGFLQVQWVHGGFRIIIIKRTNLEGSESFSGDVVPVQGFTIACIEMGQATECKEEPNNMDGNGTNITCWVCVVKGADVLGTQGSYIINIINAKFINGFPHWVLILEYKNDI